MLRSSERRTRATSELAKTALDWRFLDAVDGKALLFPIPEFPEKKAKRMMGYHLIPGQIGAFLSHRKCWEACVAKNQTTLIFEDDFVLLPAFEKVIDFLMHQNSQWDLIRLQALEDSPYEVIFQKDTFALAKNTSDPLGCTAYLVKPKAAKKLLAKSQQIYEPIDHYLEHVQRHGIPMLAIRPYPTDISHVETTVPLPDRPPLRGWKKWRRSLMRWLDRHFSKDPWFPKA